MYYIYKYDMNYNHKLLFMTFDKTIASRICMNVNRCLFYTHKEV